MTRNNRLPADDEHLVGLLRAAYVLDVASAPRQHSQRTPQCPSLPRFGAALHRDDWTAAERQHVYESGCVYCGKVLGMFERAAAAQGEPSSPVGEESTVASADPKMAQRTSASRAEKESSGQELSAGTVTRCAHAVLQRPELWPSLARELRPWLVAILRRKATGHPDVDAVLTFIRERLFATPPQESYRSVILNWVLEFLAVPPQTEADETFIEQAALDQVLEQAGEFEPPEARLFREEALKQALPSSQALLKFAPPAIARASWLPTFRLQLFYEVERLKAKGLQFFQWN